MTEHDIEKKIEHAFTSSVPNVLEGVLSKCGSQNSEVTAMPQGGSAGKFFRWAACIAAALVLALTGVMGTYLYRTNYNVASIVSLDVNPSIEIKTNQREKILEVNALNEDGKIVIGDMSFKGSTLDVTVNALIGSMLRNGYLNDAQNSILVSVVGENNESSAALQEKLTEEINAILEADTFSGAVLSQIISPDSALQELADSYNISLGKARLIRQVVLLKPQYSLEELAGLTINELNLMSEMNGIALEDVQIVGSASDKAYIGIENAKDTALSHAGVLSDSDVSGLEIEMDFEHGIVIYEVSFFYNGSKYNYDIDACTGEITEFKSNPTEDKGKTESNDKQPSENTNDKNTAYTETNNAGGTSYTETDIGISSAKEIAFSHAGAASENSVTELEIEKDSEHGIMIYEVSFVYNGIEYDYEINAITGEIAEFESSPANNSGKTEVKDKQPTDNADKKSADSEPLNTSSTSGTNTAIGADKAKEIALSHAGAASEDSVTKLEIEKDNEHGVIIYEVSFSFNGFKYEYEIDAGTGEITEFKSSPAGNKEKSESKDKKTTSDTEKNSAAVTSDAAIGADRAKEIVLSHAEIGTSDIESFKCDTYINKGVSVYKIKFISDGYEYSCDVDCSTGEIIKFDKQPQYTR